VQVIDWKDSVSKTTYNVLMGTLNPTHLWGLLVKFLRLDALSIAQQQRLSTEGMALKYTSVN